MNIDTDALLALPTKDKLELVELLWDNIGEAKDVSLPKWALTEMHRRSDEMEADPTLGLSHAETWQKIANRNG